MSTSGRPAEHIEVTAYYIVSELLTNAGKHARASVVRVTVEQRDKTLRLSVRDDGVGGADPARGSGLIGLRDRVEAIGGTAVIQSPAGAGTLSWFPCRSIGPFDSRAQAPQAHGPRHRSLGLTDPVRPARRSQAPAPCVPGADQARYGRSLIPVLPCRQGLPDAGGWAAASIVRMLTP